MVNRCGIDMKSNKIYLKLYTTSHLKFDPCLYYLHIHPKSDPHILFTLIWHNQIRDDKIILFFLRCTLLYGRPSEAKIIEVNICIHADLIGCSRVLLMIITFLNISPFIFMKHNLLFGYFYRWKFSNVIPYLPVCMPAAWLCYLTVPAKPTQVKFSSRRKLSAGLHIRQLPVISRPVRMQYVGFISGSLSRKYRRTSNQLW